MVRTGKDYGLPAEYADWVERGKDEFSRPGFERIEIRATHWYPSETGECARILRIDLLVQPKPKPKPTVPNVQPGGVVRYVDHSGDPIRLMRTQFSSPGWVDQQGNTYSDDAVLCDVNDDGFTVELEGL